MARGKLKTRFVSLGLGALSGLLALFTSGCPHLKDSIRPPVAPDGQGGQHHGTYVEHHSQLIWSGQGLNRLKKLTLRHTGPIRVRTLPHAKQVTIELRLDAEPENHQNLVREFQAKVAQVSQLEGTSPVLQIPGSDCVEHREPDGRLGSVEQGVCVRELQLVVPPGKLLSLDLSWQGAARIAGLEAHELILNLPPDGSLALERVAANLWIEGGGPSATLTADRILRAFSPGSEAQGDLTLKLTQIQAASLKTVLGKVLIFLDQPQGAKVALDGQAIDKFPFQRNPIPKPE